jgi:hypothetical protein
MCSNYFICIYLFCSFFSFTVTFTAGTKAASASPPRATIGNYNKHCVFVCHFYCIVYLLSFSAIWLAIWLDRCSHMASHLANIVFCFAHATCVVVVFLGEHLGLAFDIEDPIKQFHSRSSLGSGARKRVYAPTFLF